MVSSKRVSIAALAMVCALLIPAPPAVAAEFHATSHTIRDKFFDAEKGDGSWSDPSSWERANHQRVDHQCPASNADIGIIGVGRTMSVAAPLGRAGDQPVIRIDPGGELVTARSFDQPLQLNGGTLRLANYHQCDLRGRIDLTATSTLVSSNSTDDALHLSGAILGSPAAQLLLQGNVHWTDDSSGGYSSPILVQGRYQLFLDSHQSGKCITAAGIFLQPAARVAIQSDDPVPWRLSTDITGSGTIADPAGDGPRREVVLAGATLHPDLRYGSNTLSIAANLGFADGTNGKPTLLMLDVTADNNSRLVVQGTLTDTLNQADLKLMVAPSVDPQHLKNLSLNILTVLDGDITAYKPFHGVIVQQGDHTGTATVTFEIDPVTEMSVAIVSGIELDP